jgi:hypothetical protein
VVDQRETLTLSLIAGSAAPTGLARYRLATGATASVHLKFT